MIISRTPYRISFLGGGTDYPGWYHEHGGIVLATSIDKYCYITCRHLPPFFDHRSRIAYSRIELCNSHDEIGHPAVRATLAHLGIERGVEITCAADLPARSGMGSSSAFTVGLLHALHALEGRMVGQRQLAKEAIHVEQVLLEETVGSQDQVMTACGGLNTVSFATTGDIDVQPLILPRQRAQAFEDHLLLFYTGIKRTASNVAKSYVDGIAARERQLKAMTELVDRGLAVLTGSGDVTEFGDLLHEAWTLKRSLSDKVSNSEVDALYAGARSAGAIGGKLTGAGGGGFLLLFAPPERHAAIRERLAGQLHIPFRFERHGTQIVFADANDEYAEAAEERDRQTIAAFRELDQAA